ncbi:MAG: Na+/H+ antiporter NhaC family protein [Eubacteriales bacterium]|nr:Na+/H+ antiporter NhaC family protein [Eubacteriales bacterium]
MEAINVGFLSLLPPLIAIILALKTKEVISSLIVGILSGTLIYSINVADGFFNVGTKTIEVTINLMTEKLASNGAIIIFLGLLGALVMIVTKAGGSKAYGEWAVKKIKSRKGAQLSTWLLGTLIFIDDYFNCLTVGTVMRPVTDKYKISREKLAYIIDATAAPICIIAPVSSWAASVISQMNDTGLNGIQDFVRAIPYNLYALLTIIFVIILCVSNLEFGQMAKFEKKALEGNLEDNDFQANEEEEDDELSKLKISDKGKVFDLTIPILTLIVSSILSMLYIGGYFEGGMSLAEGFGNTDAGAALAISGFFTIIVTFFLFVPRKVVSFSDFMSCIAMGVKSMVSAYIILILAWTISGVCRDLLSTGEFVGGLVADFNLAGGLIPAMAFIVSGILAFSMGTSWGTFGILIPIISVVCESFAPELTIISLSAVLAGSVFGDHCSPISDTTILSSTGAKCNHINHVSTQIPYTLVVAFSSLVGYIVAGFTSNLMLTWVSSLVCMFIIIFILHKRSEKLLNK